jgi:UDP-glucose 4-epimerase
MVYVENSDNCFSPINIGTGTGHSVFEVIAMIENVTGYAINPTHVARRAGDPAALVADVSLAKDLLKWSSKRNLHDIVSSAWDAWQLGHK